MRNPFLTILTAGALLLAGGCAGSHNELPSDAVVAVGEEVLTRADLRSALPGGLSAEDSAALAQAYVRNWVDRKLIANVAAREVDMAEINRLVDEYREELIMNRYRREMVRRADNAEFSPDSLRSYYDSHISEFRLQRPLVQGVYLKVPDNSPALAQLKRLYKNPSGMNLDRLEQLAAGAAIHFDLFDNRWVDWEQIEARIPAEFPGGAARFLQTNGNLEYSAGGFTYLLHVSDYLLPGSPMPFEAASPIVLDRIRNSVRRSYDTQLRRELEERALRTGQLRYPGNPD